LEFAAQQHRGQRREADQAQFILHPLEVAQLLRGRDYPDAVVAAGVLHDVIEDTGVDSGELERRFGARVAALVTAVSEPAGDGSYRERKAQLRDSITAADADAVAIFAADKVAKARELRMSLARDPDSSTPTSTSTTGLRSRCSSTAWVITRWCVSCASS
jgi:(p)ppGpp synthase/HD superfamily hydrolase